MTTMYVLTDETGGPVGVFDSPEVPRKQIEGYCGAFDELQFTDIRESGLEWMLTIKTKEFENYHLTMHYFTLNEI